MFEFITKFINKFTIIEGWTVAISITAIIISIVSYFKTSVLDRRQIRVHKLEEMIEIVILIMSNYHNFDDLYLMQRRIEISNDLPENDLLRLKERKYVEAVKGISNEIKLRENIIRLGILANTYLPNTGLKNRVRSFISLISCLHERTINHNIENTVETFETYPRPWILLPYVEELLTDLIKEMKLGYASNMYGENPHLEKFKEELNIK